jgi:DNA-binding NtrC family response regulator
MQKIQILVICSHQEILQTILRLINQNEKWQGSGAADGQKALEIYGASSFDLVLLGSGISEETEKNLVKEFRDRRPGIKIIQHFGGGSGLLANEIEAALTDEKNGNFGSMENLLKH